MPKPSPKFAGNKELASLGAAIRAARGEVGLSQEALAAEAELGRGYVGGIERGEHNLTLMNLSRIAKALGKRPSVLLAAASL
ncbi:helix-turn-helix domain-containing protein [Ramlibacter tataouinensis]|uniref:Transcriptional regulator, XRE family-like protein n=1 Tax=Ramlibacter tataouinensis (strain ATCC BAA-407 / DSM 14655 / LMG 21543 / TTB310) TaxID=365046 RepID=F5Y4P3_RAMTT|nr:helix-turn-helix transcriptional regulator [Ramlibacter tataouinensis]AEG91361.1 transcriptional regulator, XRE family-like protein [Ramlibacter tataouinensis TTB310]